jgi:hypothetical protein
VENLDAVLKKKSDKSYFFAPQKSPKHVWSGEYDQLTGAFGVGVAFVERRVLSGGNLDLQFSEISWWL